MFKIGWKLRGIKGPFHIENNRIGILIWNVEQENLSDLNFTTNESFVSIHHLIIPECLISLKGRYLIHVAIHFKEIEKMK